MEAIKNILVTGGGAPGAPGILKAILESNKDITLLASTSLSWLRPTFIVQLYLFAVDASCAAARA